jgi:hypothetical protein
MSYLNQYVSKVIEIELSSKKTIIGKLVEYGSNILVVFNGQKFIYIPFLHINLIRQCDSKDTEFTVVAGNTPIDKESDKLSLTRILNNAKGIFVEIYISGNQSVYGYITNIRNDYFVFYSPAYKTIYIPIEHLKWLIPYLDQSPYDLKSESLVIPLEIELADTFEEQIKKLEGEVVLFDLGKDPNKIGLIKNIEQNTVELVSGNGQIHYLNITHIKSLQRANI